MRPGAGYSALKHAELACGAALGLMLAGCAGKPETVPFTPSALQGGGPPWCRDTKSAGLRTAGHPRPESAAPARPGSGVVARCGGHGSKVFRTADGVVFQDCDGDHEKCGGSHDFTRRICRSVRFARTYLSGVA